jgi:flagellin-like protein
MRLKGISPLVATIMLIAFTLIIAGIVSAFVVNFTETQQAQIKSCVDAKVLLQRATYNPATDKLTLTIYNYGRVDLEFEVMLTYPSNAAHAAKPIEIYGTPVSVPAKSGENIVVFDVTGVADDLDTVTIKSARCDSPCVQCPGAQDFMRYTDIKGMGY